MMNLIKNELYKTFKSKKIYIFMIILFIVQIAMTILFYKLNGSVFTVIEVANGQSLPLALLPGMGQFMSIYIAIFVADSITEEYRNGTLKLSLLHPVDRVQLINSKIISLFIFILTMFTFIIVSSYVTGTLAFGWGDMTVYEGVVYTTREGIALTLQSAVTAILPNLGYGILVVFIAVLSSSMGATIGISLGLSMVLTYITAIEQMKPYSIIYQMHFYHKGFMNAFTWESIIIDTISIIAYIIIFYIGTVKIFRRKEILY